MLIHQLALNPRDEHNYQPTILSLIPSHLDQLHSCAGEITAVHKESRVTAKSKAAVMPFNAHQKARAEDSTCQKWLETTLQCLDLLVGLQYWKNSIAYTAANLSNTNR